MFGTSADTGDQEGAIRMTTVERDPVKGRYKSKVICDVCHGTRYLLWMGPYDIQSTTARCHHCEGRGYVIVPITEARGSK